MWSLIEREFQCLCVGEEREGVIAAAPLNTVRLLPEQDTYLSRKIEQRGWDNENTTAISLGLSYRKEEIEHIPGEWVISLPNGSTWNEYARDYFPLCVSHRSVAEAASLGWRGRHGLIVTPEFGPALRLASVFIPVRVDSPARELKGCGECRACREVCPVLDKGWREDDLNFNSALSKLEPVSLQLSKRALKRLAPRIRQLVNAVR